MNNNVFKSYDAEELRTQVIKYKTRSTVFAVLFAIVSLFIISVAVIVIVFIINIKPMVNKILGNDFNIASISQISEKNKIDLEKFTTKLAFIDDVINIMYYYDKDNDKVEDAMFAGYMNAIGDKYAEYFPKKEFEDFTEKTTEGVYYGLGCRVRQDEKTNDCIVNVVYEDSPAEKGGLIKDDIFVSIDGENVRGLDLNIIVSKIRGEEGVKRELVIYRPSEDKNIELTVYCGKVDIKLVNSEILEGNIGYLDIDEFTGKASTQFRTEIDKLLEKDIKGLIIDLRDNPGGELITVCEMMDYMVRDNDGKFTLNQKEPIFDEGKTLLVYIKEKEQVVDAAYADDKHSVDIPIVILTNLNTASAAELFTECLRDYGKATVVGLKTYGKGVVQNIIPYDDGSAIKFTVSEYFPPSGYSIDMKGIKPDYSLDMVGTEIEYDENNNIIVFEDNTRIVFSSDGKIIDESVATRSTISETKSKVMDIEHIENLKIYDTDNKFLDEDWFIDLDAKYEDKQLLQALVILKE